MQQVWLGRWSSRSWLDEPCYPRLVPLLLAPFFSFDIPDADLMVLLLFSFLCIVVKGFLFLKFQVVFGFTGKKNEQKMLNISPSRQIN